MDMIFWLLVVAVMLVIEIFTMGLTTIWFSLGALGATLAAALHAPIWLQSVLFVVVSILIMILVRPFAMKVVNKERAKTNIDELIGKKVLVVEEIDNRRGQGKVRCGGVEWTARSVDDTVLEKEETVVIESVSGVKLMVMREEEKQTGQ